MLVSYRQLAATTAVTARVVESESGVGVGGVACFQLESESGVGVVFLNCWSRSRSRVFKNAGVGVGSRSRFFKTAGVGVGSRSRFFKTAGVGVRSRSRNPKKSSDSTTLLSSNTEGSSRNCRKIFQTVSDRPKIMEKFSQPAG